MPVIKLQHVVSVSSEDKNHPAENIIKGDAYKKWKCVSGEKQASIVLQLEKASCIHAIDIGNEGSAFVEVLVGCQTSGDDDQKNYQVLLVASSFMSPLESRNGTNTNRVRMFASEKLSKATLDKKWDRVKIVCTQPFNKTSQYGLSFIKFHSPPDSSDTTATVQTTRVGSFVVKDEDDEEKLKAILPGSFFAKRKTVASPPKGAAEIRAASAKAEAESMFASSKTNKQTPAKRKLDMKDEGEEIKAKKAKTPPSKAAIKPSIPSVSRESSSVSRPSSESKKTSTSHKKVDTKAVPLNKIMSRVVFALSGFQNPLRSDLRDKATEMGAKYRPDWNVGCTHLICAFANTPKYQQVKKAKGHIVKKEWILDCHRKKMALSWKQYKLKGKNEDDDDSSEDSSDYTEVDDVSQSKPTSKTTKDGNLDEGEKSVLKKGTEDKYDEKGIDCNKDDEYAGSTDVDSPMPSPSHDDDDGHKDEKLRVMKVNTVGDGDYANDDVDDDDEDETSELPMPTLPDFFGGFVFFLYGEFKDDERRQLVRYITAFNGRLEEYMNECVTYVVTKSDWDDNFDEALATNGSLIFAKPRWLLACATQRRLVPYQPYIVVPSDM